MRLAMIIYAPQIITARHGRERAIKRKNFQTMARKIEVANDLRPQQRNHVRANGKLESRQNFLGDRRTTEHMPALEHEHFLPCARKIRGMREPVVPSADHDCIVRNSH